MNESYVTITGNVVADPERRVAASGGTWATLRVASTIRKPIRDGVGFEDGHTNFFNVAAWRSLADNVLAAVKKGQPVIVTGKLRVVNYTRSDGTTGTSVEIDAQHIGHDLRLGTTAFTKGTRQVVIDGDRMSEPEVNDARESDWGAPDPDADASAAPSVRAPDFVPYATPGEQTEGVDERGASALARTGSGSGGLV